MSKVPVKKTPIAPKTTPPKLIDAMCEALKKAGIEVKRDGWLDFHHNKEGKFVQEDPCEWIDIVLKDNEGHKHLVHFYFDTDSTRLTDVEIFVRKKRKGYKEAKFVASTDNNKENSTP